MTFSARFRATHRRAVVAGLAALTVALASCSSDGDPDDAAQSPATSTAAGDAPAPIDSHSPAAPSTDLPPPQTASSPSVSVDANTPVPKAGREGQAAAPAVSADPVTPQQPVVYPDNVSLGIDDVTFGVESDKGPGAFPGREYAVISISMTNGSASAIDLDTAIVTVLDSTNNPVAQIFPRELALTDLAGTLSPGTSTSASYAFAVPASSRTQVTVVVDFDAAHTSAVFRGDIS